MVVESFLNGHHVPYDVAQADSLLVNYLLFGLEIVDIVVSNGSGASGRGSALSEIS